MSSQFPAVPEERNLPTTPPALAKPLGGAMVEPGESSATSHLYRLLAAVRRYRWLVLAVTVLGSAGGIVASRFVSPEYEARAVIWIEVSSNQSLNQGPIRSGQLLQSSAWIDLLRSFAVLDEVVREERLYVETKAENRDVFRNFALQSQFRPGDYRLEVASGGGSYTLYAGRTEVERGRVGDRVGEPLGFDWRPPMGLLPAGRVIDFAVVHPRDAAVALGNDLRATLAREGNFMQLSLTDIDPEFASNTLNAVMDRYVTVAAEIKRAQLDQLTAVLADQRMVAEANLRDAEIALEQFRVQTVTLPSDRGAPVAAGLTITTDPVMSRFFELQIELDQYRNDREAIDRILGEYESSGLPLDALMMIPSVQSAGALRTALEEHQVRRAEKRALLERYTEDHPTVVRVTQFIDELERATIPALSNELRAQILDRERELESRIGAATSELRQIPPRAIEEARLERQVAIAENLHSVLKQRYEEARLSAASTIPDVRVLDQAVPPTRPSRDTSQMVLAMGLLGSLGLSLVAVLILDRLDPRVRYPEEVTYGMGLSILGVLPDVRKITSKTGDEAATQAAEGFREIRMNVINAHGAAGPVTLTVTSPGSGDGKSFVSSNLALSFADQQYRTLVIDGDVRRGTLHRTLGIDRVPGLTDYLAGDVGLGEILRPTEFDNVFVIPSGTRRRNGPELLGSATMTQLLMELKPRFDAILIDSPPLGAGVDAFALGTLTHNVLFILRTGSTDRTMAAAKLDIVDRLPIRVLGAVLNGTPSDTSPYRYYSYIAGYDLPENEPESGQLLGKGS